MRVGLLDIKTCVDKAREMAEQYQLYVKSPSSRKSIDKLLWICREYLQKDIVVNLLEDPVPHGTVLGTYIKENDRFVINIQPGQNFCWRRFVLCKEIFHVLLDEPECRITSIGDHLDEVAAVFPVIDSTPGPAVVSEVLAELAAMEFMYPYSDRVKHRQTPNFPQLAELYKIPQVLVEKYLSDSYMENLGAFPN